MSKAAVSESATIHSDGVGAASPDMRHARGSASATIHQSDSTRLLPWLIPTTAIAFLAAGMSLMVAVLYPQINESQFEKQAQIVEAQRIHIESLGERIRLAERESRVATERYNDLAREVVRMGGKAGH